MKKQVIILLLLIIIVITGCDKNQLENVQNSDLNQETNENIKEEQNTDIVQNSEYTELEIFGATAYFKQHNPTNYWDCDDDFGAGEINTVFIPSENGVIVENYYDKEKISGIFFYETENIISDKETIIAKHKRWYGVDVTVQNIDKNLFKKYIKGESQNVYLESYNFQYEGDYDGEKFDVYYTIELLIYKKDYTEEQIDKLISEYNTIIDTFKLN